MTSSTLHIHSTDSLDSPLQLPPTETSSSPVGSGESCPRKLTYTSTSFHPETEGSSERSNKTVIESLRHYVNVRQMDWAQHLIHVETAINNSINATTGMTPTELLYGALIHLFPHPTNTKSDFPAVPEFLERINVSIAIAQDRHVMAKRRSPISAAARNRNTKSVTLSTSAPRTSGARSKRRASVLSSSIDL
jgi:hypothetical protein